MSIIRCPDCKNDVSSKAEYCPNCGRSIAPKKSAIGIVVAVVVVLIVGIGLIKASGHL